MLAEVTSSIPDFICVSAAKLMKLIETHEANHIEFARMRNIAEDILLMDNDPQQSKVLDLLLDPTWLATGMTSNLIFVLPPEMQGQSLLLSRPGLRMTLLGFDVEYNASKLTV